MTGALELPLFGEQAREKAQAFYSEETLGKLTPRERKAAEDAAEFNRYFENKSAGTNFAPAFNALLGPFDEAAKAVILKLLQSKVPAARGDRRRPGSIPTWANWTRICATDIRRWPRT